MSDGFRAASFEWLLKEAEMFAFHFAAVNRPTKCEGVGVLPASSKSCVETRRDGQIAFNYASRAAQSMVAAEIDYLEVIIDEAMQRMDMFENEAVLGYATFVLLQREMNLFINKRNVVGTLNDKEIQTFARQSADDIFCGPKLMPAPRV